jgi:hypothetical protein
MGADWIVVDEDGGEAWSNWICPSCFTWHQLEDYTKLDNMAVTESTLIACATEYNKCEELLQAARQRLHVANRELEKASSGFHEAYKRMAAARDALIIARLSALDDR